MVFLKKISSWIARGTEQALAKGDTGVTLTRTDKSDVLKHKQFPGLQYKSSSQL